MAGPGGSGTMGEGKPILSTALMSDNLARLLRALFKELRNESRTLRMNETQFVDGYRTLKGPIDSTVTTKSNCSRCCWSPSKRRHYAGHPSRDLPHLHHDDDAGDVQGVPHPPRRVFARVQYH